MRSQIISVLILIITLFNVDVSWSDYIIDQSWERPESPYGWDSMSIRNGEPLGQEFIAGADSITAVALSISYSDFNPCGPTSFTAKIRNSTITGTVIALSTITLENQFETQANPSDEWRYFDFEEAFSIIPGNRYVIDLSIPTGSEYWCWNSWEDSDNIGIPGRIIYSGEYYDPGGEVDSAFGFRTYTVPEPATLLLFSFGCLILRRKHWKILPPR